METTILLIRHGETNWNKEKRFQGQKDIPLNNNGKVQALLLGQKLFNHGMRIDAIYSSDLQRAKITAEIIASKYSSEVKINLGLRERYFGILEGIKLEEIKKKYPDLDLLNLEKYEFLDLEPFTRFKARIYGAVLDITKEHVNQNIAIVSHGAAINSLLYEISHGSIGSGITKIVNTSISTVVYNHKNQTWSVKEINDTSHIEVV